MLIRTSQIVVLGIIYYLPDYSNIINEFVWSYDDHVPELVRTRRFLHYWRSNIDGVIKEVKLGVGGSSSRRYSSVDEIFDL